MYINEIVIDDELDHHGDINIFIDTINGETYLERAEAVELIKHMTKVFNINPAEVFETCLN